MNLAKPHLDVGLFSNRRDDQLAFWQQAVGLPTTTWARWAAGCSSTAIT